MGPVAARTKTPCPAAHGSYACHTARLPLARAYFLLRHLRFPTQRYSRIERNAAVDRLPLRLRPYAHYAGPDAGSGSSTHTRTYPHLPAPNQPQPPPPSPISRLRGLRFTYTRLLGCSGRVGATPAPPAGNTWAIQPDYCRPRRITRHAGRRAVAGAQPSNLFHYRLLLRTPPAARRTHAVAQAR